MVTKRSGPRSRPMTTAAFVTSSTAERPINAPPASKRREDNIDLPSSRSVTRLDACEHGSFRELLASQRCSWRRDGRREVRHLATKNLVQGREQGDRSLIRNPVEDLLGLATRLDDAALTQLGELLRQAWLAKTEIGLEIANGAFAVEQRAGDHEPVWIGEALHERAGSLRLLARDRGVAFLWLAHDHSQAAPGSASSGNLR